jgi:hypothetical protein
VIGIGDKAKLVAYGIQECSEQIPWLPQTTDRNSLYVPSHDAVELAIPFTHRNV